MLPVNEEAKGWKTSRMAKVELIADPLWPVYEIQYDEDIPAGVAINEAVELAKEVRCRQFTGIY